MRLTHALIPDIDCKIAKQAWCAQAVSETNLAFIPDPSTQISERYLRPAAEAHSANRAFRPRLPEGKVGLP